MNATGLTNEDRAAIAAALGKVDKRIVMNILKKIEDGGIPTDRELDILHKAGAPLPAAPVAAPQAAAEFQLEKMIVPTDRKGQAKFYDAGEKTVKTWAKIGRDNNDPAPLTDPPAMVQWWERLREKGALKHRVPENLLEAAARFEKAAAAPVAMVPAVPVAPLEPIDFDELENAELTFEMGSKMARLNYQVHAKMLRDAFAANDPDKTRAAHSAFEKAFEMWVKSEGRKKRIMEEEGLTVSRDEVRLNIIEIHRPIPGRLKASLKACYRFLPEPRPPQAMWNDAVERSVGESCHELIDDLQKSIA